MKKLFSAIVAALGFPLLMACSGGQGQAAAAAEPVVVPADAIPFVLDGHIYLSANLGDSLRGNFVFDTGADRLYFDKEFYASSGIRPLKSMKALMGGVGGAHQKVEYLTLDSLKLSSGGFYRPFTDAVVFDLRPILGCHADGMVGLRPFLERPLELNYSASFMRQHDSLPSTEGYLRLPLEVDNGRMFTQAAVGVDAAHRMQGRFLIDVGSGSYLTLTRAATEKGGFRAAEKPQRVLELAVGGVGGKSRTVYMRADWVALGADTLRRVPIECSSDSGGALGNRPYDGLLGNRLLSRYDVLFDFAGKALYLKPRTGLPVAMACCPRQFIYANRTDISPYWVVLGVFEGSSAAQAGLKAGDRIVRLNGRAVSEYTWKQERQLATAAYELVVVGEDGSERTVRYDASEDVL